MSISIPGNFFAVRFIGFVPFGQESSLNFQRMFYDSFEAFCYEPITKSFSVNSGGFQTDDTVFSRNILYFKVTIQLLKTKVDP